MSACFVSSRRRHPIFNGRWSLDVFFFYSSRRRHTRFKCDWSSDVCSSDLTFLFGVGRADSTVRSALPTPRRERSPPRRDGAVQTDPHSASLSQNPGLGSVDRKSVV